MMSPSGWANSTSVPPDQKVNKLRINLISIYFDSAQGTKVSKAKEY